MLSMLALILTLAATPAQAFAPTGIHIRVKAPAPAAEAALDAGVPVALTVVIDDGENYYRRTDFALDPRRATFEWDVKAVPGGDYAVIAALVDRNGKVLKQIEQHVVRIPQAGGR